MKYWKEIDQLFYFIKIMAGTCKECTFYVKMNHFVVVGSKEVWVFFLIKRQNGEIYIRNFRQFLFGMSPDVPAFKFLIVHVTLNFELE